MNSRKWQIFIGLLIVPVGFSSFVGSARAAEMRGSPISESELAKQLKLYESVSSIEASFVQVKTLAEMGFQIKSEGYFKIVRPDHILWEVRKPGKVRVTLDPDQIRIESGEGKDMNVQTLKRSEAPSDKTTQNLSGLVAWLNLDAKVLHSQYDVFQTAKQTFRFAPHDLKAGPFRSIEMTLADGGQMRHLVIQETSGDTMELTFTHPKLTRKSE